MDAPKLEVLIACYDEAGIKRIAAASHPVVDGVAYTVSWQKGDTDIPEEIASRNDFRVIRTDSFGSANNRNNALAHARGEILLISDDDLHYTAEGLQRVIKAFDSRPQCDALTFRYDTDCVEKRYSEAEYDWQRPPKGAWVTSFEIAFRREAVKGKVWFNPHFGVNCDFCAGEEDIFFDTMLRMGLRIHFVPETICYHPGPTTCTRRDMASLVEAKGASFLAIRRGTWLLRMVVHALRSKQPIEYCRYWLRGVRKARRLRVFEPED